MAEPKALLLTRPHAQSEDFAGVIAARLPGRFEPVIAPLIEIVPLAAELDLAGLQGLLFTSANGVAQFAARTSDRSLPALCVGDITAQAARVAGFAAESADGDVTALVGLAHARFRTGAGAYLHVRGRHAAGDLAGALAAVGVNVRAAEIYDQAPRAMRPEAEALLAAARIDAVALFSPRSARLFAAAAREAGWPMGGTTAVSLSEAADAALAGLAFGRRLVAAAPTREGMLASLAKA